MLLRLSEPSGKFTVTMRRGGKKAQNTGVRGQTMLRFLANNQIDALFHVFIYFISRRVPSITVLVIRRSNCINTSSGMISVCKWLLGMPVRTGIPSSHLHTLIIPDDVLIQFDLLMTSTVMLETCREMK